MHTFTKTALLLALAAMLVAFSYPPRGGGLFKAIQRRDVGAVKYLLKYQRGSELNTTYATVEGDFTPLQWAVHSLLYPVSGNMYGNAKPANEAERKKSLDIIALLLNRGVDVNAYDRHGDTPLHHAVRFLHQPLTELLLQHQAYINMRNSAGETVLHVIARDTRGYRGRAELAELLLDEGASHSIRDKADQTALDIAFANDDTALQRVLADYKQLP